MIDTGGRDTAAVRTRIQTLLGPAAKVTDISTTRGVVGSSLTAVNLAGLTRIELGFGLCLAAAAGALVFALGLTERRRSFAIADALGASRRQLGSFVWSESSVLIGGGLSGAAGLGWALSRMLTSVLTGVFDPRAHGAHGSRGYLVAIVVTTTARDRCSVDRHRFATHGGHHSAAIRELSRPRFEPQRCAGKDGCPQAQSREVISVVRVFVSVADRGCWPANACSTGSICPSRTVQPLSSRGAAT